MEDLSQSARDCWGQALNWMSAQYHAQVQMNKLCAQWLPWLLIVDQKRRQKNVSMQCLAMLNRHPQDIFHWFVASVANLKAIFSNLKI